MVKTEGAFDMIAIPPSGENQNSWGARLYLSGGYTRIRFRRVPTY
jgi:hypothetical protein